MSFMCIRDFECFRQNWGSFGPAWNSKAKDWSSKRGLKTGSQNGAPKLKREPKIAPACLAAISKDSLGPKIGLKNGHERVVKRTPKLLQDMRERFYWRLSHGRHDLGMTWARCMHGEPSV